MSKKSKPLAERIKDRADAAVTTERLVTALRNKRITTAELCKKLECTERGLLDAICVAQSESYLVTLYGDRWSIEKAPVREPKRTVYESRPDGTYLFGFSGDQHLCSKYERRDVLDAI